MASEAIKAVRKMMREAALEGACPWGSCGAGPSQPCRTAKGGFRKNPHAKRVERAFAEGRIKIR